MKNEGLIILAGLEGNEPTHLKGLQLMIEPHIDFLIFAWWMLLLATTVYLIGTYIILPLTRPQ